MLTLDLWSLMPEMHFFQVNYAVKLCFVQCLSPQIHSCCLRCKEVGLGDWVYVPGDVRLFQLSRHLRNYFS